MSGLWVLNHALVVSAIISSCQQDASQPSEAWDRFNAPEYLTKEYIKRFDELPLSAAIKYIPYADSYWPNERGGAAYRWYVEEIGSDIELYPEEELYEFSLEDMRELSPAEKYDIYRSRYDYPLTSAELERTNPDDPEWFGLCHGWAAAAANFSEPTTVILENEEGLQVPFMSADVKALLAFAQQDRSVASKKKLLGLRCMSDLSTTPQDVRTPQCKGVNAGTFHLIMANLIGLDSKPVIADIDREIEVWNFTAYAYDSTIIDEDAYVYPTAAPGTIKVMRLQTFMKYSRDIEPMAEAHGDEDVGQREQENYEYFIELNDKNEIIGGQWIGDDRPDFLWQQGPPDLRAPDWLALIEVLRGAKVTTY